MADESGVSTGQFGKSSVRAYDGHRPQKITIIGNGAIGQELFRKLTNEGKADEIVVWNRTPPKDEVILDKDGEPAPTEIAKLKAFHRDVDEGNRALIRHSRSAKSTSHFTPLYGDENLSQAMRGADIVIVTAGAQRDFLRDEEGKLIKKDGKKVSEKREALTEKNYAIIDKVARAAGSAKDDANYIILTNPVDNMTQLFQERSGVRHEQVMGLSGILDETRLERAVSAVMGLHPDDIKDLKVVGQHGENMVPLLDEVMVRSGGEWKKLTETASPEQLEQITKETKGGGQWYKDTRDTTANIAPAMSASVMVDDIIDSKWKGLDVAPIEATAWLDKEKLYINHTVKIDKGRVISQGVPDLTSFASKKGWGAAVKALRAGMEEMPDRKSQSMAIA